MRYSKFLSLGFAAMAAGLFATAGPAAAEAGPPSAVKSETTIAPRAPVMHEGAGLGITHDVIVLSAKEIGGSPGIVGNDALITAAPIGDGGTERITAREGDGGNTGKACHLVSAPAVAAATQDEGAGLG